MKQQKFKKSNYIVLALLLMFIIARALYQGFADVSNRPLGIFILMNFIIFALCFLSSPKQIHQITPNHLHVVYHDNVGSCKNSAEVVIVDSLPEEEFTEEILEVDKHVILVENAVGEIVAAVSSDNESDHESNFGRNHRQLELRRLERGMSKELVITMKESPLRSTLMDDMSNEEFRFAIEAFIAERNKVMMQENIHEEEEIYIYPLCVSAHFNT